MLLILREALFGGKAVINTYVSSSSLKRITAWSSDILNYSLHSYVSDYNDVQGSLTPSIYGLSEKRQIFFVITFGKFCAYHIPHYILPDCTVMGCVKKRCKIVITHLGQT